MSGLNIIEKFGAVAVLLMIFGAVFLYDSGGGSNDTEGTFNKWVDITEDAVAEGNMTDWTEMSISLMPIFFLLFFVFLIGYALFK